MASGYYVHRNLLTDWQQKTFKNYFTYDYDNSTEKYNGIALENLFETSNYTTSSLSTLSNYGSDADTFKYIPSSSSPDWSLFTSLDNCFGPSLSGVLKGESPTFGTCVFDSTTDEDNFAMRDNFIFYLSSDRKEISIDAIDMYGNRSGHGEISASKFPDNFIPNKLLFVIQGAGGGGGGERASSSGHGGAGGGLVAVIGDLAGGEITVTLGRGGAGGAAGSGKSGSDGGPSTFTDYTGTIKINGGKGGREGGAGGDDHMAKGGTVELNGSGSHYIIAMQTGGKGGVNELTATTTFTGQTQQGEVFPLSQINMATKTDAPLTNMVLDRTGSRGSTSSATAGSGAGSFFGNGGAAGKNNSGSDNAGKDGTYGAGGGGGGNATLNDTYGKGGNGGDAVLKVYY